MEDASTEQSVGCWEITPLQFYKDVYLFSLFLSQLCSKFPFHFFYANILSPSIYVHRSLLIFSNARRIFHALSTLIVTFLTASTESSLSKNSQRQT